MGLTDERLIEWAIAGRALPGSERSGDEGLVLSHRTGALVAAIDGLGHGEEAAAAAAAAVQVLRARSEEPPDSLLHACHRALRQTRGAAMCVASLGTGGRLRWAGVGNVAALVARAAPAGGREHLRTVPGVVGFRMGRPWTGTVQAAPGDLLVMASDGIAPEFSEGLDPSRELAPLAEELLARFGRAEDDALVVAVRWIGGGRSGTTTERSER